MSGGSAGGGSTTVGPTTGGQAAGGQAAGGPTVRGVRLDPADPAVVVPLVAGSAEELWAAVAATATLPVRVLEWRVDHLAVAADSATHRALVLELLPGLRAALGPERALLLTLRTGHEGGARDLPDRDLRDLLVAACALRDADGAPLVDLVDVEVARDPAAVAAVVEAAHAHGVLVVGSFHDLHGTPSHAAIVERLRAQRTAGADVVKIAVTPRSPQDVLTVLGAGLAVEGPRIVIAMGELGAVTRLAAGTFGSCATFAAAGTASAPGQLAVADVVAVLGMLRR